MKMPGTRSLGRTWRYRRQAPSVVLRQRLQSVGDLAGLRIEEGFELEHSRPISHERLEALQANPRIAQVAGRNAGHGVIAVLLNDFRAAADEIVADGSAMALVLNADVDDSIQRDALPGKAVV